MTGGSIPRRATLADRAAVEDLQHAAYAPMAAIAGGTPLPLLADYREVMAASETWVVDRPEGGLTAALILQHQDDATLVWSVAVRPDSAPKGLGRALLALAEERALAAGRDLMRLYTNVLFSRNRDIYRRFGYVEVSQEKVGDRTPPWIIVHMEKRIRSAA